jgi:hypothetical protein
MRNATLEYGTDERAKNAQELYGAFDIGLDAQPTPVWISRNLQHFRFPDTMQSAHFPDMWIRKTLVNRRMVGPLSNAFSEMVVRWTREARAVYGLNQFVRCYCFGDSGKPNLYWWGAAWDLSPKVNGEILSEVIDVFTRHGFTHDRKRLRTFEFW